MEDPSALKESWKNEIMQVESDFAELLEKEGLHAAFIAYAANDAVLMRNNQLIIGRDSIDLKYTGENSKGLNWKPEFVDVSDSGDMAYTYGYYSFKFVDKEGNPSESKGVFHTVWKRQKDKTWKFVWD